MPQRQQVAWAKLRVGVMVIVSLIVLAVGIFFISGQVGFFSRRYALKSYFSSAGGVREGSEVRLAGIPVGNVKSIRISPLLDPQRAVEIDMRVSRRYQDEIRADSVATLETAGLLGEAYVDISRGPGQKVLGNGEEVRSQEEADIKRIVQNANDVVSNLRVLSSTLNNITQQVQSGQGSVGKLIYDQSFYNRVNSTAASAAQVMENVKGGHGTVGRLLTDETVYERVVATLDRINQIVDDVQHGQGSMAKFINDPTVYNDVKQLVERGDAIMDKVNTGQGTLGRLINDPQLYNHVNDTVAHFDTISSRMAKGEGTLGRLSTDPTLFNNLNASSQSIREFLIEFMKNPRRYLTLHLRIF
jgi:phospholipid/cholesterol/gamma-HCH transport system substrate-binding protein